jgi:hypothetical protein
MDEEPFWGARRVGTGFRHLAPLKGRSNAQYANPAWCRVFYFCA